VAAAGVVAGAPPRAGLTRRGGVGPPRRARLLADAVVRRLLG